MTDLLLPLTVWHWLAIALILFGIEMAFGTFDLLFVSLAAFGTAAFAAFGPAPLNGWEGQLAVFAAASTGLVVLGRTVFAGMRRVVGEHPTLNRRMESLIGERAAVTRSFQAGTGRVKIGDTEWLAESVDGTNYGIGDTVTVEAHRSTKVIVKAT